MSGEVIPMPRRAGPEPWVTKRQLAQHLGCSTRTIERLVLEGMPSRPPETSPTNKRMFRIGDIERWLEERRAS